MLPKSDPIPIPQIKPDQVIHYNDNAAKLLSSRPPSQKSKQTNSIGIQLKYLLTYHTSH